jgi:hypothetical protein
MVNFKIEPSGRLFTVASIVPRMSVKDMYFCVAKEVVAQGLCPLGFSAEELMAHDEFVIQGRGGVCIISPVLDKLDGVSVVGNLASEIFICVRLPSRGGSVVDVL